MTISKDQATAIAQANAPAGGYSPSQVEEWANWAVSNPDVIYSPDPAAQMANAMVASQTQASQAATSRGDTAAAAAETPTASYTPIDTSGIAAAQPVSQPTSQASAPLERNPFFETLTPRTGYDYDAFYKVRPLEDGGTAPTPESINEAFEMYFNRPADMPGIQGYMDSGKSIEQIRADLGYQSLYAPELTLAPNAQYYEAPSQAQLGYIQSLGGGAPTSEREDLFSYTAPIFTEQDVIEMYDRLGYPPTAADIEYYTKIYPTSPDVRFSPNPRMQIVNAILAGSDLPQYQYLKEGTDLTTDENFFSYAGTPRSPASIADAGYVDYRTSPSTQTMARFCGFFCDDNFYPFD